MRETSLSPEQLSRDRVLTRESILLFNDANRFEGSVESGLVLNLESSASSTLTLRPCFQDFSRFDRLSFKAHNRSREPVLVGLKLVHGSRSGSLEVSDISLTGGREEIPPGEISNLKFPVESFSSYGTPEGWLDIREIQVIVSREKTSDGKEHIEILVGDLYGESREIPAGPRLTDKGLTSVLARDVAGVTAFHTVKVSGTSFSTESKGPRSSAPFTGEDLWLSMPPPHPYPLESAQEILSGHIMGQRLSHPISWDCNPLGCLEWRHFLHRHHFLRPLVKALAETGEDRYTRALNEIIQSWIKFNPVPMDSNGGAGPSWETLSVAWRLREWLWIAGIVWFRESFQPETRVIMLCSVWEHARSLMDHQGHPNNWIIVESAALALAGLCFPEFSEAELWMETGIERLQTQFQRQFFHDGVHFEISPLYHSICLGAMLEVKQAADARGVRLPENFGSPLETCADYLAALCRPDFTWPSINDSGSVGGDYTILMRKVGEIFNRQDLIWLGCKGKRGKPPQPSARIFPVSGIATMRSHYGRDANFLVFRAGPPGATHVHGDALSLDVAAMGLPRLVDPGITTYAPDLLTEHYRSAGAHNTLLIDGKGPWHSSMTFLEKTRPAVSDLCWSFVDGLQVITGTSRGPWQNLDRDTAICRTIIFIKGEYWIVRDIAMGQGTHELAACWQFFPGRVEIDDETQAAVCVDVNGARFQLIPLLGSVHFEVGRFTGSIRPYAGWVSIEGSDLPGTSCVYTITGPLPMIMVWAMVPFCGRPFSKIEATRWDGTNGEVRLSLIFPEGYKDLLTMHAPVLSDQRKGAAGTHGGLSFSRIGHIAPRSSRGIDARDIDSTM